MTPIDLRLSADGRQARLTSLLDEETLRFEEELNRETDLALPQQQAFLAASPREFRLFQMRDASGRAAMQIAMHVHRPSRLKRLGRAIAARMGKGIHPEEELRALPMLRTLCARSGDLMTLRLMPMRSSAAELDSFEERARGAGFALAKPMSYTRTLRFSLEGSLEEIAARLSRKTRPKLHHRTRGEIDLRALTDPKYIPQCRAALQAAFERTGGDPNEFDFEAAFHLAQTRPDRARIFGIFMPNRPEELLAFVVGLYGGGQAAEYTAAGSLLDPVLRKMPFNYFLMWELAKWAHGCGAKFLDLGGITPGGPDDPRASISDFKRHLCQNDRQDEAEVSRELLTTLMPVRATLMETAIRVRGSLASLRQAARKPSGRLAAGTAATLALFAVLSMGLRLAGSPSNPAFAQLARQAHAPEIAIVGDSRAHVGISPTLLLQGLKSAGIPVTDSYNYAVDGTDVAHHYSFVKRGLMESVTPPRVVLWTPNPLQFNEMRQSNRLEQFSAADIPDLYRVGAPLETLLDIATMAAFPPYRERPLVRHAIFEDYAGRAEIRLLPLQRRLLGLHTQPQLLLSRRYREAGDGQQPFDVLDWRDRFVRGEQGYLQQFDSLALSDWHFKLARAMMRKIRESGSLLVIVEMPVAPYYQQHIATLPQHQRWRARLREIARQEGALFWSHADRYHDDHLFGDPGHMPESTAKDYSLYLANELAGDPTVRAALERRNRL